LKLAYAQFEELENFARFGARLDADSLKTIEHGQRIRACLKQAESSPLSLSAQICILLALTNGLFDAVPLDSIKQAQQAIVDNLSKIEQDALLSLEQGDSLTDEDKQHLLKMLKTTLIDFTSQVTAQNQQTVSVSSD
jgi:F-type H+-transporting ATPase subunit alpha